MELEGKLDMLGKFQKLDSDILLEFYWMKLKLDLEMELFLETTTFSVKSDKDILKDQTK